MAAVGINTTAPVRSACLRLTAPEGRYTCRMMTGQELLAGIVLGLGGGIMYGRWWTERRRAKESMRKLWADKHKNRGDMSWWW